jgi:hypothetical protein
MPAAVNKWVIRVISYAPWSNVGWYDTIFSLKIFRRFEVDGLAAGKHIYLSGHQAFVQVPDLFPLPVPSFGPLPPLPVPSPGPWPPPLR